MPDPRARILIVDDDPDIRAALAEALAQEGYAVDLAVHGKQALAWLKSGNPLPNLMLLDLTMPQMSGWELWAEIKKDPRLAPLSVVVLSAGAAAGLEGLEPGRFLAKPITLSDLIETVARYC